ncbi:unnamed protein product, partial [Nesidiocoris tenuis]
MFARNRAHIMLLHNQLGLPTCLIASRTVMVCCSKKLGSRVEYQHQSWAKLNAVLPNLIEKCRKAYICLLD